MNLAVLAHAAAAQTPLAVALAVVVAVAVFFPVQGALVLRWLLGTERGRIVLLVTVVAFGWWYDHGARFSAGYTAGVASEKQRSQAAQVRAAFASLETYMKQAERFAAIGEKLERERDAAAKAARDRVVADVRAGRLRLREDWRDLPASATASERDGQAERRATAAGRAVGIGAAADAQLAACQAVIRADRGLTP
jgi:hypothetical protein